MDGDFSHKISRGSLPELTAIWGYPGATPSGEQGQSLATFLQESSLAKSTKEDSGKPNSQSFKNSGQILFQRQCPKRQSQVEQSKGPQR